MGHKTKLLCNTWDVGEVVLASELTRAGFTAGDLKNYVASGYLKRLPVGAYLRGDSLTWAAAVSALNRTAAVTVSEKSALQLHGTQHNLELGEKTTLFLMSPKRIKLPSWFLYAMKQTDKLLFYRSRELFVDNSLGLETVIQDKRELTVSSKIRAYLEFFDGVPYRNSFEEGLNLIDWLFEPNLLEVRKLLLNCRSLKAKRLFLFSAEHQGHQWVSKLNLSGIDLGRGVLHLDTQGDWSEKYQLTYPMNDNDRKDWL